MVAPDRRCDPTSVRRRLQGSAGQSTVEWLVVMVGLIALAGVLATTLPGVAGTITGDGAQHDLQGRRDELSQQLVAGLRDQAAVRPGDHPSRSIHRLRPTGPAIGGHPRDVGAGPPLPGLGVGHRRAERRGEDRLQGRLQGRRLGHLRAHHVAVQHRRHGHAERDAVGLGRHQGDGRRQRRGQGHGRRRLRIAGRQDELRRQDQSGQRRQDRPRRASAAEPRRPVQHPQGQLDHAQPRQLQGLGGIGHLPQHHRGAGLQGRPSRLLGRRARRRRQGADHGGRHRLRRQPAQPEVRRRPRRRRRECRQRLPGRQGPGRRPRPLDPGRAVGLRALHRLGTAAGIRRARLLGPDHVAARSPPPTPTRSRSRSARSAGRPAGPPTRARSSRPRTPTAPR